MTNLGLYNAGQKSGNAPIANYWSAYHVYLLVSFIITDGTAPRDVYRAGPGYAYAWQLVDVGLLEPSQDPVPWDSSRASFRITAAGRRLVEKLAQAAGTSASPKNAP